MATNPWQDKLVINKFMTPYTKPRSAEEEEKRLKQTAKLSVVAQAMQSLSDMANMGMGADVLPSQNNVLPYTMGKLNNIQEQDMQYDRARANMLSDLMQKATQYDIEQGRIKDTREYNEGVRQDEWARRDQKTEEDRAYREQLQMKENEEWKNRRDYDQKLWNQKENERLKRYQAERNAYESIKSKYASQYNDKDVYMRIPFQDGSAAEISELDANSMITYISQYAPERLEKMLPMIGIESWDPKLKLSDYQMQKIITENWDTVAHLQKTPVGGQGGGQEGGQANQTQNKSIERLNTIIDAKELQPAQKVEIIKAILIKDFGYSEAEATRMAMQKLGVNQNN